MTLFSLADTKAYPTPKRKTLAGLFQFLAKALFSKPSPDPFREAMATFRAQEREALARGCTRDVAAVRKRRRAFLHAELARASQGRAG